MNKHTSDCNICAIYREPIMQCATQRVPSWTTGSKVFYCVTCFKLFERPEERLALHYFFLQRSHPLHAMRTQDCWSISLSIRQMLESSETNKLIRLCKSTSSTYGKPCSYMFSNFYISCKITHIILTTICQLCDSQK